ncbi:MAG: hypothetical protein ACLUI0_12075 [Blautia massiliensis (ex Durand et al. 2017)]
MWSSQTMESTDPRRRRTIEYQNNASIGRARAGITGIGNYSGYFTTVFYINRGSISNCDITLSDTFLTYDGTEKKPPVTLSNATAIH